MNSFNKKEFQNMSKRLIQIFGENGKPTLVDLAEAFKGVTEFSDSQLALLRVSDPVLTAIAQGYRNEEYVGSFLFPRVPSEKESGYFPAFGKEAFRIYTTKRPLRGEVTKMEVLTGRVQLTLTEHSLGFELDEREIKEFASTKDQLVTMRQLMVSDALDLEREYAQAVLATTPGNFATANKKNGGTNWGSTGSPVTDIKVAREAIRQQIGRYPNVAIFDPTAWRLFTENADVKDRIKYTQRAIVTEDIAASLLEIPTVKVGRAVYGTGGPGGVGETALTMSDLWGSVQAGNVVLAHVGSGWGMPGFGYTYEKIGYPQVSSYYWQRTKSEVFEEQRIYDAAITLASAGYLIYNAN